MPKQHENDPHMTDDGKLHQISAEIGGLKVAVEIMTDMWQRQETVASAGRKALHDKFELFRQEVGIELASLALRVDRLTDQVKLYEPSVTAFKEDKLRKEGAEGLGKRMIAAMTLAAGAIGWGLHEFIGWLHLK